MSMSKRDFEAVARVIKSEADKALSPDVDNAVYRIAAGLAEVFEDANPAFDTDRFLKAAGVVS